MDLAAQRLRFVRQERRESRANAATSLEAKRRELGRVFKVVDDDDDGMNLGYENS